MAPDNPAAPVYLPEFGVEISWAMCRNACCRNFGIPYRGPSSLGSGTLSGDVGRIKRDDGAYQCKACEQSFDLKSNRAIRQIARYFLSLSLPYDDCDDPTCLNHGVNVFEHYTRPGVHVAPWPNQPASGPVKKGRRYRRKAEYRVLCRGCDETFTLGSPRWTATGDEAAAQCEELILGMADQRSVSKTINRTRMGAGQIYARSRRLAGRLRDWFAWRNAKLLHPNFWSEGGCAYVHTDDMVISLRRPRKARGKSAPHPTDRHQIFVVTVSTVSLEGTHYILAAHPHYLPAERCPERQDLVLERRHRVPPWASRWASLWHEFEPGRERRAASPNVSLPGMFIHEHYAHLAHFLVIGKMLARCPRVYHYIDGSKPLMAAAVTAFAERIKAGTSEVAVLQRRTKEAARGRVPKGPCQLRKTLGEWEARVKEHVNDPTGFDFGGEGPPDRKVLAKAWKTAPRSAYSDKTKWAWLEWPPSAKAVRDPRTLWLTWKPGKTIEEGFEFLRRATLQSVDSSHDSLRSRADGAVRAHYRSSPGPGFRSANVNPLGVYNEIVVAMVMFNFSRPYKERRNYETTPADEMGVAPNTDRASWPLVDGKRISPLRDVGAAYFAKIAWDVQLGLREAETMTKWLHR